MLWNPQGTPARSVPTSRGTVSGGASNEPLTAVLSSSSRPHSSSSFCCIRNYHPYLPIWDLRQMDPQSSAQAAVTGHLRLGDFNNRYWFPHSSRGWKSKTKISAELVSGEAFFCTRGRMAYKWSPSHSGLFSVHTHRETVVEPHPYLILNISLQNLSKYHHIGEEGFKIRICGAHNSSNHELCCKANHVIGSFSEHL